MLFLLIGCSTEMTWGGGQSGNEDSAQPPVCEERGRVDVGLDTVANGFAFAPRAIRAVTEGTWRGWLEVDRASDPVDASLEIAFGRSQLVTSHLVGIRGYDGRGDTEWEAFDEPSEQCPTRYELGATATLRTDDGSFDEVLPFTITATAAFVPNVTAVQIHGWVPLEELRGTHAAPPWDASGIGSALHLYATLDETRMLYGETTWVSQEPLDPGSRNPAEQLLGGFAMTRPDDLPSGGH
jgi:hypothetical protein